MSKIIERLLENARVLGEHDMPLSSHINRQAANHIIELESQLATANERVKELQELNNRWIKIATKHYPLNWAMDPGNPELTMSNIVEQLAERAVRAEKLIEACKAANFIDESGMVRKVIGTLALTADGVVAGNGATIWPHSDVFIEDEAGGNVVQCIRDNNTDDLLAPDEWEIDECYSSKQASHDAARKEVEHGNGCI